MVAIAICLSTTDEPTGQKLDQKINLVAGILKECPYNVLIYGRFIGGPSRARTWDHLIKSQLLYQLS